VVLKQVHDGKLPSAEAARVRRLLRQFCRLKVLTCLARLHRRSVREELRGVLAAFDGVKAMMDASREDLPRVFSEIHARIDAERAGARS
jgi:hypothetical protein